MQVAHFYRIRLIGLLVGVIIVPAPARALLTFDGGRDRLFSTGSVSMVYDSNITASRTGQADMIYSGGAGLKYTRRAGIISVDASAGISTSHFGKSTGDDFSDPHFQGKFSAKDTRTSADLTLSTARESQADLVAGIRAVSWNSEASFNTRYRVTDRYSLASTFGTTWRNFVTNTSALTNLKSYNAGINLLYTINSARDFFVGYNFGLQETGRGLSYYDHSLNVGVEGKILPKLDGSISVGYELQDPHGSTDRSTGSTTEAIALTWNFSRRLKITGNLSQNFSAIATNGSVNTLAASLDAAFSMTPKTGLSGGVGSGYTRFIDAASAGRRDIYFTWNAGTSYFINEHFTTSLGYVYYQNWSTSSFSDFIRHTITLALNLRF
jgi:hypothetical protein